MINQDFILTDNLNIEDIKLFFLDTNETSFNIEDFTILPISTTLEELMVISGAFPSKSIAKKAGFCGQIKPGFTKSGTKKKPIWILKDF